MKFSFFNGYYNNLHRVEDEGSSSHLLKGVRSWSPLVRICTFDLFRCWGGVVAWACCNKHRPLTVTVIRIRKGVSPFASTEDGTGWFIFFKDWRTLFTQISCVLCRGANFAFCYVGARLGRWQTASSVTLNPWVSSEETLSQRRQIYSSLWPPLLSKCLLENKQD